MKHATMNRLPTRRQMIGGALAVGVALGGGLDANTDPAAAKVYLGTVEVLHCRTKPVSHGTIEHCRSFVNGLLRGQSTTDRRHFEKQVGDNRVIDDFTRVDSIKFNKRGHAISRTGSRATKHTVIGYGDSHPIIDVAEPVCSDDITGASRFCPPSVYQAQQDCHAMGGVFRIDAVGAVARCEPNLSSPPPLSSASAN